VCHPETGLDLEQFATGGSSENWGALAIRFARSCAPHDAGLPCRVLPVKGDSLPLGNDASTGPRFPVPTVRP
jgi:hypothetical protein